MKTRQTGVNCFASGRSNEYWRTVVAASPGDGFLKSFSAANPTFHSASMGDFSSPSYQCTAAKPFFSSSRHNPKSSLGRPVFLACYGERLPIPLERSADFHWSGRNLDRANPRKTGAARCRLITRKLFRDINIVSSSANECDLPF
jgi:hypothetical protein